MSVFDRAAPPNRDRPARAFAARAASSAIAAVIATVMGACGGIGINAGDPASTFAEDGGTASEGAAFASADGASLDAGLTSSGEAGLAIGNGSVAPTAATSCGDTSLCSPDQSTANGCTTDSPDAADGGGETVGDAGAPSASNDSGGGANGGTACRVRNVAASGSGSGSTGGGGTSSTSLASVCTIAGTGIDGSACSSGADCASGFDCIGTPGVCRRYCCSGTCTAGSSFCDVQPAAGQNSSSGQTAAAIPVCVPIATCKLLMPNACATGSTCGIVADDGTTSCLTIGVATEGDDCDSVHCADNLVCLGQSGSRRCEKLCTISGTDCATGQTCTGNAQVFTDPTIGVCQ